MKIKNYEVPKPIAWFAGALLYLAVLRCIDVALLVAYAWFNVESTAILVSASVVMGFAGGFVMFYFTVGLTQRAHLKSQQLLLDKTLETWRDLILKSQELNQDGNNRRIEGDEWKDG